MTGIQAKLVANRSGVMYVLRNSEASLPVVSLTRSSIDGLMVLLNFSQQNTSIKASVYAIIYIRW